MNHKVSHPKINNKKINNNIFDKNELKQQTNLMNNSKIYINEWLKLQEISSDGLKYKWNSHDNEPPKNWFNKDITKINNFLNNNNQNNSYENSITPGTNIIENKKYYSTYEDWFFDNYEPVYNKDSVEQLFNIIEDLIEEYNYKIINKKTFKNNLIHFIYKNSC